MSHNVPLPPTSNELEVNAAAQMEQQPSEKKKVRKVRRKETKPRQRADPTFKRVIERLVLAMSADSKATEFKVKQLTSPDLFVEIPPGTNTVGTPFEFFRQYNIIEFKGKNDPLNELKLMTQMGRILSWLGDQKTVKYKQTLNVIVVAHLPPKLLDTLARKWKLRFTKSSAGFYEGKSPPQDIVIVACDELPVEPKYAAWLLFADPNSEKWREGLLMMANQQMVDLLAEAEKLYPKEYRTMDARIEERLATFNAKEREEYLEALDGLAEDRLIRMPSERRQKVLSVLPPEERLKGLPAEQVASALTPEERLKGLPPEERLKGLPTEQLGDALSKLPPEELTKILERLQPPKQS